MAVSGRVGMWRGGVRSSMSVSAPFVWRCLSGSSRSSVSTPRSSNRTCRFPASGSRTRPHAVFRVRRHRSRTSENIESNSLMRLDSGVEFCLRGDVEAEEIEGAGLGGRWPCEDCCGACVAEEDAVAGQVGEVLQEGAEAMDGLAVFRALARGFAPRRGRDFGLADGGRALGGRGFGIVVLKQHRGEVALHVPDDVVGQHAQKDMGSDAMGPAMVDRTDVEVARFEVAEAAFG